MSNYIKHFLTVTCHRNKVLINCIKAGIPLQGLMHDLSKYSPTEFIPGGKYYQGFRSPNEKERETVGHSAAWMHHKGRNKHHFEYWTDYDFKTKTVKPVPMPDKYIVEMFCDRVAASKNYMGSNYSNESPLNYFLKGKKTRFIDSGTSDKIEFLLRMLAEKGEKETFTYIRKRF
ncbi:MAG: DUF5662 family protein [Clostridia bacterium]|nr:DUF5662 family protein [Clostridia bacterium]